MSEGKLIHEFTVSGIKCSLREFKGFTGRTEVVVMVDGASTPRGGNVAIAGFTAIEKPRSNSISLMPIRTLEGLNIKLPEQAPSSVSKLTLSDAVSK